MIFLFERAGRRDDACGAVGVCVCSWEGPAAVGCSISGAWGEVCRGGAKGVLSGRGDRFGRGFVSGREGGACVYVIVTFFERAAPSLRYV